MILGLSRRRSRVRVPSLPSLNQAARASDLSESGAVDPALITQSPRFRRGVILMDFDIGVAERWPWRPRRGSLLTAEDHAEMLECLVAVVEAFDLLGAVT